MNTQQARSPTCFPAAASLDILFPERSLCMKTALLFPCVSGLLAPLPAFCSAVRASIPMKYLSVRDITSWGEVNGYMPHGTVMLITADAGVLF
jgi:hypothetical protein